MLVNKSLKTKIHSRGKYCADYINASFFLPVLNSKVNDALKVLVYNEHETCFIRSANHQ